MWLTLRILSAWLRAVRKAQLWLPTCDFERRIKGNTNDKGIYKGLLSGDRPIWVLKPNQITQARNTVQSCTWDVFADALLTEAMRRKLWEVWQPICLWSWQRLRRPPCKQLSWRSNWRSGKAHHRSRFLLGSTGIKSISSCMFFLFVWNVGVQIETRRICWSAARRSQEFWSHCFSSSWEVTNPSEISGVFLMTEPSR